MFFFQFDQFGENHFGTESGNSSFVGGFDSTTAEPSDPYAAVTAVDVQRAEPESIRKWREEQTARLAEMDATEQTQIAEWKEQAMHEVEEWYKQHNEQVPWE